MTSSSSSPPPSELSNSDSDQVCDSPTRKPKSATKGRRVAGKTIYKKTNQVEQSLSRSVSHKDLPYRKKSSKPSKSKTLESITGKSDLNYIDEANSSAKPPKTTNEEPLTRFEQLFTPPESQQYTTTSKNTQNGDDLPGRKSTIDSFAPPLPSQPKPRLSKLQSFKTMPIRRRGSSSSREGFLHKGRDLPFVTMVGLLEPKIPTLVSAARKLFYFENSFSHIFASFNEPLIENIRTHLQLGPTVYIGPHCPTEYEVPSYVSLSNTNLVPKKNKIVLPSKLINLLNNDNRTVLELPKPQPQSNGSSGWEKTCASAAINPTFTNASTFSISLAPKDMYFPAIDSVFFNCPKLLSTLFASEYPNATQLFLSGPDGQSKGKSLFSSISLFGPTTTVLSIDSWMTDIIATKSCPDILPKFTHLSILSMTNSSYLTDLGSAAFFKALKNSSIFSTLEIFNLSGSLNNSLCVDTWGDFNSFLGSCSKLAFLGLRNCSALADFSKTDSFFAKTSKTIGNLTTNNTSLIPEKTISTCAQNFASAIGSLVVQKLKRLDFSDNPKLGPFLTNSLAKKLFRKSSNCRIVSLRNCGLQECPSIAVGVKSCHSLFVLDVSWNPKFDIKPLLSISYSHPTLKYLKLAGCNLNGSELVAFLDCPFSKCSSLDLSSNPISPTLISPSIATNQFLHHLDLSNCSLAIPSSNMTDRSSGSHSLLYNLGQHPNIAWLNLSRNPALFVGDSVSTGKLSKKVPDSSGEYFTSAANPLSYSFSSLLRGNYSYLNLAQVSLPGSLLRSTLSISPELALSECLYLNLNDNPLVDEGVVAIGSWLNQLQSPHRLKQIHLSNVGMTSVGFKALVTGFKNCPSLTHLVACHNEITPK